MFEHYSSILSKSPKETYLCFNPHCQTPMNRVFIDSAFHASFKYCHSWVIRIDQLQNQDSKELPTEEDGYLVDYSKSPIEAILIFRKSRAKMRLRMEEQLEKVREEVNSHIKVVEEIMLMKINQMFDNFERIGAAYEEISEQIKTKCEYMASFKLQQLIVNEKLQSMEFYDDLILFSDEKVDAQILQIKKSIESMIDQMVFTRKLPSFLTNKKQIIGLKSFLSKDEPQSFEKIQKLAKLLKEDHNLIYEKIKKNNGSNTEHEFRLNCLLCPETYSYIGKKITNTKNIEKLLEHMFKEHFDTLIFNYSYFISKKAIEEVNLQYLFCLTRNEYEGIDLLFLEGRKIFDLKTANRKRLQIQILKTSEYPLNLIKYMKVGGDKEMTMILAIIIYHFENVLKKSVTLYSGNLELKKWMEFCRKNAIENVKFMGSVMVSKVNEVSLEEEKDNEKSLISPSQ